MFWKYEWTYVFASLNTASEHGPFGSDTVEGASYTRNVNAPLDNPGHGDAHLGEHLIEEGEGVYLLCRRMGA